MGYWQYLPIYCLVGVAPGQGYRGTENTRRVVRLENLTQYGYRGTTVCQAPPLWQLGSLPHHVEGTTSGPSRGGEKVEIKT